MQRPCLLNRVHQLHSDEQIPPLCSGINVKVIAKRRRVACCVLAWGVLLLFFTVGCVRCYFCTVGFSRRTPQRATCVGGCRNDTAVADFA